MNEFDSSRSTDANVPRWAIGVALAVVALVLVVASGGPGELFSSQLPYFGDQAGHDWWLSAFRQHLLSGTPLTWSDAINNGFLFGYFYFPLPPLIVTLLATVASVPVAIKLMILGSVFSVSVGLWQFVKGLGYGRQVQVLTIATSLVALLSNHAITIGGTLFDTLLGEFSMAYSLSFGLCTIGAYARLRRGTGSWWMMGLWAALTLLAHVQGALVTAIAIAVWLAWDFRNVAVVRYGAGAALLAAGLSAWWWLPAVGAARQSLGDTNPVIHNAATFLAQGSVCWLVGLGAVGLILATWRGRPGAKEMLVTSGVVVGALYLPLQIADTGRLLPLVFLLASVGIALLATDVRALVGQRSAQRFAGPVTAGGVVALALAATMVSGANATIAASTDSQTFAGYASVPAAPAMTALTHELGQLPAGRVVVETPQNYASAFGELMWPSLIPVLTHGHDASPLGLFVNATPSSIGIEYAYENVTAVYSPVVSWQPHPFHPNPLVGVRAMQTLGVRYLVATTPALKQILTSIPAAHLVATVQAPLPVAHPTNLTFTGTFWVFELRNADRVVGVSAVTPMSALGTKDYALSMTAYLDASGADPTTPLPVVGGTTYHGPAVAVSGIVTTPTSVTFHVASVGRPVVIRESYSPQWRGTGIGPILRAEPNEMVVVPTRTTVTLRFVDPVTVPIGAIVSVLSALALGGIALWSRRSRSRP